MLRKNIFTYRQKYVQLTFGNINTLFWRYISDFEQRKTRCRCKKESTSNIELISSPGFYLKEENLGWKLIIWTSNSEDKETFNQSQSRSYQPYFQSFD